jgi:hypothetical protein
MARQLAVSIIESRTGDMVLAPRKAVTQTVNYVGKEGRRRRSFLPLLGNLSKGKIAPERKKSGKIRKFIIRLKPDMSFILEANAGPMPMKVAAISTMKTKERINPRRPLALIPVNYP